MISDLIRRLTGDPDPTPLPPADARLALAAIMVRLARADHDYSAAERSRIDRILAETYKLDAASAAELRKEAETIEAKASDTVRFTRLVKEAVPYEEREAVVEALWSVAIEDGINADEHGFLRLVANLVGVSDRDSGLARQRVLAKGAS